LRFIRSIELASATYDVTVGREHMGFLSDVPTENVPQMTALLTQAFFPGLVHWEVRDEVERVHEAALEIEKDPRAIAFELLHQEAYRNKGLGQSLHAPLYNIHHLNESVLQHFVRRTYHPEGSVFVATGGVKHEEFVALLEKFLPAFEKNERVHAVSEYPSDPCLEIQWFCCGWVRCG
jgi:predicted Zn-dependent peptidase